MSQQAFFWILPLVVVVCILFQLGTGRIRLYMAPEEWQLVEKEKDEGRFWLFILAEVLLVFILIGQALSR